jgi:hypothetical protein
MRTAGNMTIRRKLAEIFVAILSAQRTTEKTGRAAIFLLFKRSPLP